MKHEKMYTGIKWIALIVCFLFQIADLTVYIFSTGNIFDMIAFHEMVMRFCTLSAIAIFLLQILILSLFKKSKLFVCIWQFLPMAAWFALLIENWAPYVHLIQDDMLDAEQFQNICLPLWINVILVAAIFSAAVENTFRGGLLRKEHREPSPVFFTEKNRE